MVKKERVIKLLRRLIAINSENPPGNESAIACFVGDYLQEIGLHPRFFTFKKNRTNVLALLEGKDATRTILITPHLDTVPAGKRWLRDPFQGDIEKGKLYGLGATDCKVNLACSLEVLRSFAEEKVKPESSIIFAATADEESGSGLGLIPLLDKGILTPSLALVLDADDFEIVITQKGLMHLKVKIEGKRAHGAYPWLGRNAIDNAIEVIAAIKAHTFLYRRNAYLKSPTVNVGTIKGGDKVNVVADWCEFELDFRFMPGSAGKDILAEVKRIISAHAKKFSLEVEGIQEPYYIDESHPLVSGLKKSMRAHKVVARVRGSEGATVITFFQDKGIPAVATGFGSEGCAHIADEFVKVENIYKGALVLEDFLKNYQCSEQRKG